MPENICLNTNIFFFYGFQLKEFQQYGFGVLHCSATKTMGDSDFTNRPALGQLNLIEQTSSRRLVNGSLATSAAFLCSTMRTEFIKSCAQKILTNELKFIFLLYIFTSCNYNPLKLKSFSNGEANLPFSKPHIGANTQIFF